MMAGYGDPGGEYPLGLEDADFPGSSPWTPPVSPPMPVASPTDNQDLLGLRSELLGLLKKPRPTLANLSTGQKIAAAFGEIGTTMQNMAGRKVPSYITGLQEKQLAEHKDVQGEALKTIALKMQMANAQQGATQARQKELNDAMKEFPVYVKGLREAGITGPAFVKAVKSRVAQLEQMSGTKILDDAEISAIDKGDANAVDLLDAAATYLTPDKARFAMGMARDPKQHGRLKEFMEEEAIGFGVNKIRQVMQEKGVSRPDAAREVIDAYPALGKHAAKIPGYLAPKEMGAAEAKNREDQSYGALLLELLNNKDINLDTYMVRAAKYPGYDAKKGLTPEQAAQFDAAKEKAVKIAGAETLNAPVAGTGKTVGEVEAEQAKLREYNRQIGQSEAALTDVGKREFFMRAIQTKLGQLQADLTIDPKSGESMVTVVARERMKGTPVPAEAAKELANYQVNLNKARDIAKKYSNEQVEKWVGMTVALASTVGLDNAFLQIQEKFRKDDKFTQFMVDNERMRGTAFDWGGKQLTPFEAAVTFGRTPTGREMTGRLWRAKVDNLISEYETRIQEFHDVIRTPRGQLGTGGGTDKNSLRKQYGY